MDKVRERIRECETELNEGRPEKNTMYIFRKEDTDPKILKEALPDVNFIYTDSQIIVTADKVE